MQRRPSGAAQGRSSTSRARASAALHAFALNGGDTRVSATRRTAPVARRLSRRCRRCTRDERPSHGADTHRRTHTQRRFGESERERERERANREKADARVSRPPRCVAAPLLASASSNSSGGDGDCRGVLGGRRSRQSAARSHNRTRRVGRETTKHFFAVGERRLLLLLLLLLLAAHGVLGGAAAAAPGAPLTRFDMAAVCGSQRRRRRGRRGRGKMAKCATGRASAVAHSCRSAEGTPTNLAACVAAETGGGARLPRLGLVSPPGCCTRCGPRAIAVAVAAVWRRNSERGAGGRAGVTAADFFLLFGLSCSFAFGSRSLLPLLPLCPLPSALRPLQP